MTNILNGFMFAIQPYNFLSIMLGVILGIILGAIPGLSPAVGLAVLLPLTFIFPANYALLFLASIYCGGMFGGSIPAILLKTPGTSAAAATAADGYALTLQGKGGEAIGMAVLASSIGGLISTILLILIAPQLSKIAIKFGPAEYFALAVFGLSIVSRMAAKNITKGLLSAFLGLFLATLGLDALTASRRFTLGLAVLYDGIPFLPALIGLFALSEIFRRVSQKDEWMPQNTLTKASFPEKKEIHNSIPTILRSSIIGTVIGILPGAGGTIGSFISYNEAIRFSKNPDKFGSGSFEGIAAAEAANNAAASGALVPLLSLGIPGSSVTAILLGAFLVYGLSPGPLIFTKHADLVYTLFAGLIIAQFLMFTFGYFGSKLVGKFVKIPYYIIAPTIITMCFIGAFSSRNNKYDIVIMIVFGLLGYILTENGFSTIPTVLGLILGPMLEVSLRRALLITGGNFLLVLNKPIVIVLLVLSFISIIEPLLKEWKTRKKS